jgi:broad specificity phosphatase PhoE
VQVPRPLRILIARHGETEWNLSRRFQGHLDSPLTGRGQDQAERLAGRLADENIGAVFSSDLGRALQTATPIAEQHGLSPRTSHLLREIDCGAWTGRTKDALAREFPEATECYRLTPSEHRMPGGESLADVQARGLAFLTELRNLAFDQTVVVITHHIVVETLLARALDLPLSELWLKTPTGNCFLSELELTADSLRGLMVYDGAHLGTSAQTVFEGERVA